MLNRLLKQFDCTYSGTPAVAGLPAYSGVVDLAALDPLQGVLPRNWHTRAAATPYAAVHDIVPHQLANPFNPTQTLHFAPTAEFTAAYYQSELVKYPARVFVEAIPALFNTNTTIGWTAGGSSISRIDGDVIASFHFCAYPVGIVCGLVPGDVSTAYNEATHAFYAHNGLLQIIESGSVAATVTGVTLADQPTLYIIREGGYVTYHVGDWIYRSTRRSAGPVLLDASLYTPADYVDSPVFGALADIGMPALRQTGSFDWVLPKIDAIFGIAYASFDWTLPKIDAQFSGRRMSGFNWVLPLPDVIFSKSKYARLELKLPLPTIQLDARAPEFSFGGFSWVLPPLAVGLLGKPGIRGSFSWELPLPAVIFSQPKYGRLELKLPLPTMYADDGPPAGTYGTMEPLYLGDVWDTGAIVFAVIYDGLGISSTATLVLLFNAAFYDGLSVAGSWTISQLIEGMIRDGLAVGESTRRLSVAGVGAAQVQREGLQYAVNLATGAVSTYQHFDFLGFTHADGKTFGYRADGIYEIGNYDDDGALVNALLDLGNVKLNTALKQRMECAYLGLGTDGTAYMKLIGDDEQEWLYEIEQRPEAAKAKFGRGLEAREWEVTLTVADASKIDLSSIEFVAFTAARRWKR